MWAICNMPKLSTVCPRSSDPFFIVTYSIKWVTTSWTDGIYIEMVSVHFAMRAQGGSFNHLMKDPRGKYYESLMRIIIFVLNLQLVLTIINIFLHKLKLCRQTCFFFNSMDACRHWTFLYDICNIEMYIVIYFFYDIWSEVAWF